MSVSLEEVLLGAGFDVRKNPQDAKWFLAQADEYDILAEKAEELDDMYSEWEDYCDINDDAPSFEEWRRAQQ